MIDSICKCNFCESDDIEEEIEDEDEE